MARDGGSLRARLLGRGQPTDERMVDALESQLEGTERVVHRLASSGGVVRERSGETRERNSGSGGTLLALTDRRLVLVIDAGTDVETAPIPYTDVKHIDTEDGLLRTRVVFAVWGEGTYRMKPAKSADVEEAVSFGSAARGAWQRSVAALQDAREHIEALPALVADGEGTAAARRREEARDKLGMASQQAAAAPEPVGRAIEERVSSVQRALARTRMEAHARRGRSLLSTARDLADADRYDAADVTLSRARSHVTTAHRIALDEGFRAVDRTRSTREAVDAERRRLAAMPLERADAALDRLLSADGLQASLRASEHALACYREALTAGWGRDTFDGDTDALRLQVEWLVARTLRLRRRLANRFEAEGDTYAALELDALAGDRYETACAHLLAAARLAAQYRAGDAAALRDRAGWVATKYRAE